jgi:hypothetical protein
VDSSRLSRAIHASRFGSLSRSQDSKLGDSDVGAALQKHTRHHSGQSAASSGALRQTLLSCHGLPGNLTRNPREHPDAIIPDPATNNVAPFTKDQVALLYVGDDYFPLGAQWEVKNKKWSKYHVADNADWWVPFYGADNSARPTGALCDGCHSVGYDIRTKQVAKWNVGCERCHGPGSEHAAHPTLANVVNPPG